MNQVILALIGGVIKLAVFGLLMKYPNWAEPKEVKRGVRNTAV